MVIIVPFRGIVSRDTYLWFAGSVACVEKTHVPVVVSADMFSVKAPQRIWRASGGPLRIWLVLEWGYAPCRLRDLEDGCQLAGHWFGHRQ